MQTQSFENLLKLNGKKVNGFTAYNKYFVLSSDSGQIVCDSDTYKTVSDTFDYTQVYETLGIYKAKKDGKYKLYSLETRQPISKEFDDIGSVYKVYAAKTGDKWQLYSLKNHAPVSEKFNRISVQGLTGVYQTETGTYNFNNEPVDNNLINIKTDGDFVYRIDNFMLNLVKKSYINNPEYGDSLGKFLSNKEQITDKESDILMGQAEFMNLVNKMEFCLGIMKVRKENPTQNLSDIFNINTQSLLNSSDQVK